MRTSFAGRLRTQGAWLIALAVLLWLPSGAAKAAPGSPPLRGKPEEPPKLVHTSTDPFKCKVCSKALQAAYGHLDKQGAADGVAGKTHWAFFLGFLYLIDGRHPDELQRIVEAMGTTLYKTGGGNQNWHVAMCALFLSEIYRREPSDQLRERLLDVLKVAGETQEPTGGWCHTRGFAASTPGYATDLASITTMMYAAMLNMKASGIPVPETLFASAQKNLESVSDGMGFSYGTGNSVSDYSMGRGAWAWLGLSKTPDACPKAFKNIPMGLRARYKSVLNGHAFPPLHYTAAALSTHLLGSSDYSKFFQYWGDRLFALQKEDGSIELPHKEMGTVSGKPLTPAEDGYVCSTAAFAIILLLQHPGAFEKGTLAPKFNPWLGFQAEAGPSEATVKSVAEESPAAKAGLQPGDVLQSWNGKPPGNLGAMKDRLNKEAPGRKVTLVILRGGEKQTIEIVVGKIAATKTMGASEF